MILGTQIRPFTLYPLDSTGCASRCCYQSAATKIVCSLRGPDYSGKVLSNLIQVRIKGYNANQCLIDTLERILSATILLENFQKGSFEYELEVLQSSSIIFSQLLSILCYITCYSGIPMNDLFAGAVVVLVDNDIYLDPTPEQLSQGTIVLTMGYLLNKKKMIHLEVSGKAMLSNTQKMLSLALRGCTTIGAFIEQKVGAI